MPRIRVESEPANSRTWTTITVSEKYGAVQAIVLGDFAIYNDRIDGQPDLKIAHVPSGMRVMSGGDMARNPNVALRMLDELNAHAKFFSDFCERAKARTLVDADFDRYSEICRGIQSRIAS
jgi:hypothetical protein